jgi:hypothetical protein
LVKEAGNDLGDAADADKVSPAGDVRMNWSNIEKWRNLLKIGTIVLSSILKYCAKFKKNWSRIFLVIAIYMWKNTVFEVMYLF